MAQSSQQNCDRIVINQMAVFTTSWFISLWLRLSPDEAGYEGPLLLFITQRIDTPLRSKITYRLHESMASPIGIWSFIPPRRVRACPELALPSASPTLSHRIMCPLPVVQYSTPVMASYAIPFTSSFCSGTTNKKV